MGLVFTPVVDALPSTLVVSEAAVASGLTLGTKTIQIIGTGELSIDGGGWVSNGVVQNGSSVRLRISTPAEELGQVTTVTVDLQSVGYVEWVVTNRDSLQDEAGTGVDETMAFSVMPTAPISESANAFDELFDGNYSFVESEGYGFDEVSYAVTTGMMVNESGAGAGVGFPAPGELVADAADATDTLLGALLLYVGEVGAGADEVTTTLSVSTNVFELGTGAGAILTSSSTELVDDSADALDELLGAVQQSELVAEYGIGTADVLDAVAPALMVDEVGAGGDILLPTNNVTINFNNVGYGFDEPLLSYPTHGAWAFNARTMAISRWEGLHVTEVHEANGRVFGLASDGIYVLSDTAASDAVVESGLYDFGVIELKHLRHLYITYTATSPVRLGVIRSNGGGKQKIEYGKPAYESENPQQTRIALGRGPLARYWGLTLSNTDGGKASVIDMRLVPNVTTRRI